ncbi:MAG TPA: RHS repeat-associated core domain-containing protein [Symbiobacteriaceae bacterium]|nr:RHS repeat-associated core domain-containing protein [Symbiobacteriaceae bacterium]
MAKGIGTELADRRTATTRVTKTEKGLRYEVFAKPVHYKDHQGRWQPIKPGLKGAGHGGPFAIESDAVPYQARFTDSAAGNEVEFRYQNTAIRFGLDASLGAGAYRSESAGSSVRYKRGNEDVEYRYELGSISLKETIILNRPTGRSVFKFPIQTENVDLTLQPDGSIEAKDESGTVAWYIPAPAVRDAAGASPPAASQMINDQGGGKVLTIQVDPEWLGAPDRVWPVEIDPTVIIAPDAAEAMDTGIDYNIDPCGTSRNDSYPSIAEMIASKLPTLSYRTCDGYQETVTSGKFALLKFNLDELPKGATLTSASLMLFQSSTYSGTLKAQPVMQAWEERTANGRFPWNDAYYAVGASIATVAFGARSWVDMNITALVDDWLQGRRPNFGVAVAGGSATITSSDALDVTLAPHLVVEVEEDLTPPSIAAFTAQVNQSAVTLQATLSNPTDVDRIEFSVDDRLVGFSERPPTSNQVAVSNIQGLTQGTHTAEVRVFDLAGNETTRSTSFVTSLAAPAAGAVSMGSGKVLVGFEPGGEAGYTYRLWRAATKDFLAPTEITPTSGRTVLDVPPVGSCPEACFYRVEVRDAVSGATVGWGPITSAAATPQPTITMTVGDNPLAVTRQFAAVREADYYPVKLEAPIHDQWRRSTPVSGELTARGDGKSLASVKSIPNMVRGQLFDFDLLGLVNQERRAMGLSALEAPDLGPLLSGATFNWSGSAQGMNGTLRSYEAALYAWNYASNKYDLTQNLTGPDGALVMSALQAAQHIDASGHLQLLVQPRFPSDGVTEARVSTDYAALTVTFQHQSPQRLSAASGGSGQILLAWQPGSLRYRVHRGTTAGFAPTDSNVIAEGWGAPSFVDSAATGITSGQTYYYRVTAPDVTGAVASNEASAVADPNPVIWITSEIAPQRDGIYYSSSSVQEFDFDLLSAAKQVFGASALSNISSSVTTVIVDWTGYGPGGFQIEYGSAFSMPAPSTSEPVRLVGSLSQPADIISYTNHTTVQFGSSTGSKNTDHIRLGFMMKPPTPTLTSLLNTDGTVTLSWGGTGGYHVYRALTSGGPPVALTTQSTNASFVDTSVEPGATYTYTIRPVDAVTGAVGLTAGSVQVTVPVKRFEESGAVTSIATWTTLADASSSGGQYMQTSGTNGRADFTFLGTSVAYIARTSSSAGTVRVYLDGVQQGTTYSLTTTSILRQQTIFSAAGLPAGYHTIRVERATGTPSVDAFDVSMIAPAPQGVSAKSVNSGVTVQWLSTVGAQGYHVYRSAFAGGPYQRLTLLPVVSTTWTDPQPLPDGYYVVTALHDDNRMTAPSAEVRMAGGIGQYDDTNSELAYIGTWQKPTDAASFMGTLHTASTAGASVALRFSGDTGAIRLLGPKGPGYGKMDVYLDGILAAAGVDQFSATPQAKQELFRREPLTAAATHTVEIRYTGTKNPSASAATIALDAIEVLPGGRPWFLAARPASNRVDLTWTGTVVATNGYRVERRAAGAANYAALPGMPVPGTQTTFADATAVNGVSYSYRVVGIGAGGVETPASNEVQALPVANRTGLDGRYPYAGLPWGGATGYVQLETGAFVLPVTDALIPEGPLAVVLRRTYNSNVTEDRGVGPGWRLNFDQTLAASGEDIIWTDGDGSQVKFLDQSGSYTAEPQTFVSLRKTAAGWEITRKDGTRNVFNPLDGTPGSGRLVSTVDPNGNQISYSLDVSGRVIDIHPSVGNRWTLTYTGGRLDTVKDGAYGSLPGQRSEGRIYRFSYGGSGQLERVTTPMTEVWTYQYDGTGKMVRVIDPAARSASLQYSGERVTAYVEEEGGPGSLGPKTTFVYNAGRTTVTNPLGQATTFVVGGNGRLVETINALGGHTFLEYDESGNLTAVVDPLNRRTQYGAYDQWGNPGFVLDALGQRVSYEYHPVLHLPTKVTDQLSRVQTIDYELVGATWRPNVTQAVSASGTADAQVVQYAYDAHGLRIKLTDPRGFETAYEYDSRGWLSRVTGPYDPATPPALRTRITTLGYDEAGNLIGKTEPSGDAGSTPRTTYYAYDLVGRLVSTTLPDQSVTVTRYDASGLPVSIADPMGAEVHYAYDSLGRLIRQTDPLGGVVQMDYDDAGNRIGVTDARGNRTATQYDALGRPVAVTDGEGNTTRTGYDPVGNATTMTLPSGYTVTAEYDALNRQIRQNAPSARYEFQYDAVGNQVLSRDGNGNWTRYEYDNLNRLVTVYDPLNLNASGGLLYDTSTPPVKLSKATTYVYDKAGNRVRTTDLSGHASVYAYNEVNQLVSETDPMNNVHRYVYDAAGQLIREIDGNGSVRLYTYDIRGNLLAVGPEQVCSCDCDSIIYEYDRAGRKTKAQTSGVTTWYRYDAAGRIVEVDQSPGSSTRYAYDPNGNMVLIALNEATWEYTYDRANRLTQVVDPSRLRTSYTYTPNGQRLRVDLPYGIQLLNTFDQSTNRLTKLQYSMPSKSSSWEISYTYDAAGNVSSQAEKLNSGTPVQTTYQYDVLNRLVKSERGTLGNSWTQIKQYTYDAVGNRTSVYTSPPNSSSSSVTETYTYDAANRVTSVKRGSSLAQKYIYDEAGRLILVDGYDPDSNTNQSARYEYDSFDRVIKVTSGTSVTSYGYDPDGKRYYRKVLDRINSDLAQMVYYQYAAGQVVAERDGTGSLVSLLTRGVGGELLSVTKPKDGSFVYLKDHLGSVRKMADKDFAFTNSYEYDEFGKVTASTEAIKNDWKFTGALYDSAASLYHLGARYYSPSDGRFITQDSWKGSPWQPWTQNLYVYVGNNPVNYVDPTGHAADAAGGGGCSGDLCEDAEAIFESDEAAAVVSGACRAGLETDYDYCVAAYYSLKANGYDVPASLKEAYPIFFNPEGTAMALVIQSSNEAMSNMATAQLLAGAGTSSAGAAGGSLGGLNCGRSHCLNQSGSH